MPPREAQCAKCKRFMFASEMTIETNYQSAAHGFLVCNGPYTSGGCFDGPPVDELDDIPPDNYGPYEDELDH